MARLRGVSEMLRQPALGRRWTLQAVAPIREVERVSSGAGEVHDGAPRLVQEGIVFDATAQSLIGGNPASWWCERSRWKCFAGDLHEVFGLQVHFAAKRIRNGRAAHLAVISHDFQGAEALEIYRMRWGVETLFSHLKRRGYQFGSARKWLAWPLWKRSQQENQKDQETSRRLQQSVHRRLECDISGVSVTIHSYCTMRVIAIGKAVPCQSADEGVARRRADGKPATLRRFPTAKPNHIDGHGGCSQPPRVTPRSVPVTTSGFF
jgi:hypothetical protein